MTPKILTSLNNHINFIYHKKIILLPPILKKNNNIIKFEDKHIWLQVIKHYVMRPA